MDSKIKNQKCYIYTRVSTEMQVDGYSLGAQRERLLKEAKHRDMKVVAEFSDEGKSGKNISGRPEFQRMLKLVEQKADEVEYVLVFKLSRFGRNAADTLNSLQFMQDYGVNLLCVEDGIDSAGASGKLMISVISAVAEIERENIKTQTMAGRWQKAREGKWNGGFSPYGYKLVNGELIIQESEAEVIRLIFDTYTNGNMGINTVAKWMNNNGFRKVIRQNGNSDRFSAHFVKGVLDNPIYAGYMPYGRRKNEKIDGTRNEYHVRKQAEYDKFEGIHKAIISKELWEKTKSKRSENAFKREKTHSLEHAHVLSGIVKCPACGASMYGTVYRKKKKDSDEFYTDMWYYICKNRKIVTGHLCTYKKHLRQDDINSQVRAVVKEAISNADFTDDIMKKIGTKENLGALLTELERMEKAKKKEEAKKSKLLQKIMILDAEDELYDSMYDDLQGLLREYTKNIAELDSNSNKTNIAIENATNKQVSAQEVYKIMQTIIELMDIMPEEDEQKIMNALLDSVQVYPEKQPNGLQVKSVRFKVPLNIGGELYSEVVIDTENSLPKARHVETVILMTKCGSEGK